MKCLARLLIRLFIILSVIILFTSCRDKTELEERGFVGAFALDICGESGGLQIAAEIMTLTKRENDDDDEDGENHLLTARGKNFADCLYELQKQSPKELSYALSKVAIISKDILEDEVRLLEVANALAQNKEICGKLLILAAEESAADVLKNCPPDWKTASGFISNYYKHSNRKATAATRLELEAFATSVREGEGFLLPVINVDDKAKSYGFNKTMLVLENRETVICEDEMSGLAFARGVGRGRLLTASHGTDTAAMRVSAQNTRYAFSEEGNRIMCAMTVNVSGHLEEYTGNITVTAQNTEILERIFAKQIMDDIKDTYLFLKHHEIDGFGVSDRIKKYRPKLYELYGETKDYLLEVKVNVIIKS
ncbi:MAG: Ger(x)C family spore germination C-terminal domain-containing protein [Defluviitaleaceae bacterium]|nr:Ger(x)C family spore germination C-terminal domain-containing protein [Defluviitaleaceae bacterium]